MVASPLRRIGVPTAIVVDLDVILSEDFSRLLKSCFVPEITSAGLSQSRSKLKQSFNEVAEKHGVETKKLVKSRGTEALQDAEREACETFLLQLGTYGLFVVPIGEVESWLAFLKAGNHGGEWLAEIFLQMGDDPTSSSYLKPDVDSLGHTFLITGCGESRIGRRSS